MYAPYIELVASVEKVEKKQVQGVRRFCNNWQQLQL